MHSLEYCSNEHPRHCTALTLREAELAISSSWSYLSHLLTKLDLQVSAICQTLTLWLVSPAAA